MIKNGQIGPNTPPEHILPDKSKTAGDKTADTREQHTATRLAAAVTAASKPVKPGK